MLFKKPEKVENCVILIISAYIITKICLNKADIHNYHFINFKFTNFNEYKIEQSLLFVSVFWCLIFDFITVFYILKPNRRNNNKLGELRKESAQLQKMKGNEMTDQQFARLKKLRDIIPQTVHQNNHQYKLIFREYVDSIGIYSVIFVLLNLSIYFIAKFSDHFYLAKILLSLVNFYGFIRACRFHEKWIN